jgi:hypothetical protein
MYSFELIEKIIRKNGFYLMCKDTYDELNTIFSIRFEDFLKSGFEVKEAKLKDHYVIKQIR